MTESMIKPISKQLIKKYGRRALWFRIIFHCKIYQVETARPQRQMPTRSTLNGDLGFSSLTVYGPRDVQRRRWRRRRRLWRRRRSFVRNRAMSVFQATAQRCDAGDQRFCTTNAVRNDVGVNRKKRKTNYPTQNVNQITDSSPSGSSTHIEAREFDDKQNASNERFDNNETSVPTRFHGCANALCPGTFPYQPISVYLFIIIVLVFLLVRRPSPPPNNLV